MGGRGVWVSVGDHMGLSFGYFFLLLHQSGEFRKVSNQKRKFDFICGCINVFHLAEIMVLISIIHICSALLTYMLLLF